MSLPTSASNDCNRHTLRRAAPGRTRRSPSVRFPSAPETTTNPRPQGHRTGKNPKAPFDHDRSRASRLLLFRVARFALMPDRQNQHDVLGRQPAILRDITVLAARQDELPPAIFGCPTQQRVVCENLKCRSYTLELRKRPLGINVGYEIEQALQIASARAVTSTRATNEPVGAEGSCRRFSRPGNRTSRPGNGPCRCRGPHARTPPPLQRIAGEVPPAAPRAPAHRP